MGFPREVPTNFRCLPVASRYNEVGYNSHPPVLSHWDERNFTIVQSSFKTWKISKTLLYHCRYYKRSWSTIDRGVMNFWPEDALFYSDTFFRSKEEKRNDVPKQGRGFFHDLRFRILWKLPQPLDGDDFPRAHDHWSPFILEEGNSLRGIFSFNSGRLQFHRWKELYNAYTSEHLKKHQMSKNQPFSFNNESPRKVETCKFCISNERDFMI